MSSAERAKRYRERHPERVAASGKRWREKNKERVAEYKRHYHIENREARNAYRIAHRADNLDQELVYGALRRAKQKGLECTITRDDIVIPEVCPALGIKLQYVPGERSDATPSLDRMDPSKGYVQGNVFVISLRANRIKCNGTAEELRAIADWMEAQ